MKLLILSSNPTLLSWKSLPKKLAAIKAVIPFEIDIQYVDTKPIVLEGRVDRSWLHNLITPYYLKGYDFVGFHFSGQQHKDWGVTPTLGGSNPRINHGSESFYWWSDENSTRKGINRFVETCLHEMLHGYFQKTGLIDVTHSTDEKYGTVVSAYKNLDWSLFPTLTKTLEKQKNALELIVASLMALLGKKPVSHIKLPVTDLLPLVKRQADKVLVDMEMLGHPMRITQGFRSVAEQNKLYAQGRSTPGRIVTKAKGGESFHNYGVACDFVFRKQGYEAKQTLWDTFGAIGKQHGFEWGADWKGDFQDIPHLQIPLSYSLKEFQTNLVDYNKYK